MIQNFIKIALRNLNRFKGYTAINLIGLALGLTCGTLILLFVVDEVSYDKFHSKINRIYKVYSGKNDTNGWPVGVKIAEYPEVEAMIYVRNASFLEIMHKNQRYTEKPIFSSEDFFRIFSFNLLKGNPSSVLDGPNKVVVTEEVAKKYFGHVDVVGETLTMADSVDFIITGVMSNVPRQSHLQFNILVSLDSYHYFNPGFNYDSHDGWGNINMHNYILLKKGVEPEAFERKITTLYMDNVGEFLKQMGMKIYVKIEPLSKIYLSDMLANGLGPEGSMEQLYLVSAIALFVILLACINFINLSTARSAYRAKEVGIRKIVGSSRGALFWQFLAESFIITIMAFLIVALLIDIVLPLFNELIGRNFTFQDLFVHEVIGGVLVMVLLVAFLSGYYPAIVLSRFKPTETLKGKVLTSYRGTSLRKGLVIFQFFISSVLVVGTLIVLAQFKFMKDNDHGFDKEQVIIVNANRLYGDTFSLASFKSEIQTLAGVKSATLANALPGSPGWQGQWTTPEGFEKEESLSVEYLAVDENYLSTLGIDLIAGRNFNDSLASDREEGLIINETAVKQMRWQSAEDAIGKTIKSPSKTPEGVVIGVVRDYHQEGLQKMIMPIVMDHAPRFSYLYAIKFEIGQTSVLVEKLQDLWKARFPGRDFHYYFLNENYNNQYKAEVRLINVLIIFSSVTILIAVIGLFGLVSFMVIARTKEIGVRKVLGAGVFDITKLLSWEFLKLVFIANIIVVPVMWYYGSIWLNNFAYRTELNLWLFLITIVTTLGIALMTVAFQTIKAGFSNPVESLKTT